MSSTTPTSLLRLPQVTAQTGCARSTIYDAIAAGRFPKPIPLGSRTVAWSSAEIEQWIAERIAVRDAALVRALP
ncbi:MAG: AlpA family transcriptional regulator [Metallibacterium scheffleri]|jgi:prophage regulatory protein|uniref:helix-turn-helix transcriptional regulator n=1 Tax=Metallibacterium scheffleri TaxID=993689 RepID=UPI0026F2B91B|nr:AlpA family transcriptional regulator [Metallibacterium scheffleri]MCK9365900.1 AlpA family transcriptional regulator [Metallibacterium scheffleri]